MVPETKLYREVNDEGHALDILSNVSDLRNDEDLFSMCAMCTAYFVG